MKRARFLGLDFSRKIKYWLYDVTAIPGKYGPFVAGNCSVTELQAVGLSQQIKRYDKILAERRAAAEYLTRRFSECDAILPQQIGDEGTRPSFHLYLLQIDPAKAGGDVQVQDNESLRWLTQERRITSQTRDQAFALTVAGAYVQAVVEPTSWLSITPGWPLTVA